MGDNYVFDKSMIAALGSFSKSLELLNKTYSSENILSSLSRSFQTLYDAQVSAIKGIANMGRLQESLRSTFKDININWEKSLSSIKNLSAVVDSTFKDWNFEEICNSYLAEEEKCDITTEEEYEIKNDVINIINSTLDEKTLEDCKEKWHEKHPVIFAIILIILELILGQLLGEIINMTTKKDSNIYIDSTNNSSIIISIPENTSVTIVDSSINYYYKVIYTDTENNNEVEGYISKRNIAIDN